MNSGLIESQGLILIMKQQYGARNAKDGESCLVLCLLHSNF